MEDHSKAADSAVRACRSAFQTSVTFRSEKWKLCQLHGLHQLLLDYREEILTAATEEYGFPRAGYERELTLILQDIARHYQNSVGVSFSPRRRSLSGICSTRCLPAGVSLILTKSLNPFRYAIAPLAASIAARNTVVVVTESTSSPFFSLLNERIGQYLDTQSIHIIQGLDLHDAVFSKVDHVYIFDEDPHRYSVILSRHGTHFHSTLPGLSLAVVDNGNGLREAVREVHQNRMFAHPLAPERLSAVFIPEEIVQVFVKGLDRFTDDQSDQGLDLEELMSTGVTSLAAGVYRCHLSRLLQSPTCSKSLFSPALLAATKSNALLVLVYTSLEQVMDALSTLDKDPLQIALLAPESKSTIQYFEQWTRSRIFSVGSIRLMIPPVICPCEHLSARALETLFPSTAFGEARMIMSGKQPNIPSLRSVQLQNEKVVKAVAPDPNQTLEFFGYMTRVFTGVGGLLGVLALGGVYIRYFR